MQRLGTYTAKFITDDIRVLINNLSPDSVQKVDAVSFINHSILDISEMITEANQMDYETRLNVTKSSSNISVYKAAGIYTDATRTINFPGHQLTTSSVGKYIVLSCLEPQNNVTFLTQIASITDANNFKVTTRYGNDISSVAYAEFGYQVEDYIYLSEFDININKFIKLVDSINGLVINKGNSVEFEGIKYNGNKKNNVYCHYSGGIIELYKGSNVSQFGSLILTFLRIPYKCDTENDLLDIKDKYVPLILAKAKAYFYESLQRPIPQDLANEITGSSNEIKKQAGN
jgi:hypothetical protein